MAKEKPQYRENIEYLNRLFPSKECFTIKEIAQAFNVSQKSAQLWLRPYYVKPIGISKPALARALCERGV